MDSLIVRESEIIEGLLKDNRLLTDELAALMSEEVRYDRSEVTDPRKSFKICFCVYLHSQTLQKDNISKVVSEVCQPC